MLKAFLIPTPVVAPVHSHTYTHTKETEAAWEKESLTVYAHEDVF